VAKTWRRWSTKKQEEKKLCTTRRDAFHFRAGFLRTLLSSAPKDRPRAVWGQAQFHHRSVRGSTQQGKSNADTAVFFPTYLLPVEQWKNWCISFIFMDSKVILLSFSIYITIEQDSLQEMIPAFR
jgi:hypothetical protein